MPVLGQLLEQPLAPDLARRGVVKNVDLPDSESYLAIGRKHRCERMVTETLVNLRRDR
jgi:hypothetical protein